MELFTATVILLYAADAAAQLCKASYLYCGKTINYLKSHGLSWKLARHPVGLYILYKCDASGGIYTIKHCKHDCHDAGTGNNDYCCGHPEEPFMLTRYERACN